MHTQYNNLEGAPAFSMYTCAIHAINFILGLDLTMVTGDTSSERMPHKSVAPDILAPDSCMENLLSRPLSGCVRFWCCHVTHVSGGIHDNPSIEMIMHVPLGAFARPPTARRGVLRRWLSHAELDWTWAARAARPNAERSPWQPRTYYSAMLARLRCHSIFASYQHLDNTASVVASCRQHHFSLLRFRLLLLSRIYSCYSAVSAAFRTFTFVCARDGALVERGS